MKKNITINLCGRLFQIDEDAYEMLQHYMDSLRSCFGRQEGGDEIADDIEARIAELFDELKAQGNEAITIEHVKDIITRIGKPEQLADGAEVNEQEGQSAFQKGMNDLRSHMAKRRLYRNPNDKMVAGVLSGFAAYTGTDATFWRLGAVLLTIFYGTGILLYIILAILLPEAKTPEELLLMEGREVNPQNLANAVIDDRELRQSSSSGLRTVISFLLKLAFGFFVAIAVITGFALLMALIGVVVAMGFVLAIPTAMEHWSLSGIWSYHPTASIVCLIALLLVLFIPVYTIIHMVLSLLKKVKPMGMAQRIAWIVIWLVALFVTVPLGINLGHLRDHYRTEQMMEDGIWMNNFDRNYLKKYGWKLVKHDNCHDQYVKSGEHYTGDSHIAYLDCWDYDCMQVYQAEAQLLPADSGTFRITCNARAAGDGVFIYATTPSSPDKPLAQVMIPAYGNTGGELWKAALDLIHDSVKAPQARKIIEANEGQGYGWSPIELIVRLESPDTLCYGVTTDPLFTGRSMDAEWFSACDFKVEKIK